METRIWCVKIFPINTKCYSKAISVLALVGVKYDTEKPNFTFTGITNHHCRARNLKFNL